MDLTPYTFGDASNADRLRYLQQQYAEASAAQEVSTSDRTVRRQRLDLLGAEIRELEAKIARSRRLRRAYAQRVRPT